LQGIFSHAATRFNFGFLRYFILDSRYHRIHHSIEKQHWNKNFASQLPFWDIVFGTAYFPKTDEWPATGLADEEEAKSTAEYLLRPFRKNWKKY
jgi:sterol desaturase/sphingolipid hydroxylase (fatty acid hydroxylase superfamily)